MKSTQSAIALSNGFAGYANVYLCSRASTFVRPVWLQSANFALGGGMNYPARHYLWEVIMPI